MSSKYYSDVEIDEHLKCQWCKSDFDEPKILPCGNSICLKCEQSLIHKNGSIMCLFCENEHPIPKDKFPVNELIKKLLKITPVTIYRGELHRKVTKKMEEIVQYMDSYTHDVNNSDSVIKSYCESLRDKVDLRTECIIATLNKYREEYLQKIDKYQAKCLETKINFNDFEAFIKMKHSENEMIANYLKEREISDAEIHNRLDKANLLFESLKSNREAFERELFSDEKLSFEQSSINLDEKTIGTFVNEIKPCLANTKSFGASETKFTFGGRPIAPFGGFN